MRESLPQSRRKFLRSSALLSSGLFLGGCLRRIPTWLPPTNQEVPLTVDVHCHFFNGTDVQMRRFVQYVVDADKEHRLDAFAAPLAQSLNWRVAPSGKAEMKRLHLEEANKKADSLEKMAKVRAGNDGKFLEQLAQHGPEVGLSAGPTGAPPDLGSVRLPQPKPGEQTKKQVLLGGTLPAFKEYFQYRYVALADYLDLYNSATNRTMDLMIAHLVDYDWPLNEGKPTKTPLMDQVKLMAQISLVSRGRVHTFAPFDPLREVAYRAGLRGANWSALDAVKSWVTDWGCIGVKLYPPMGFAPNRNSDIDPERWSGIWRWLGDVRNVPDGRGGRATIGQRLDDVLAQLYAWCLENDVPVMAHTDISNGLNQEFQRFTAADHWAGMRDQFGGLRLNFGHLGGFAETSAADWNPAAAPSTSGLNARGLVALMSLDPAAPGGRFFADSAYNEKILGNPSGLQDVYRAALSWKAAEQSQPVLQDRLMYGSDWSILMMQDHMQDYFADFVSVYAQLDKSLPVTGPTKRTLSDRFFGENAVDYLGLRDGRTRQRLVDFYAKHNMTFDGFGHPAWMDKIKA